MSEKAAQIKKKKTAIHTKIVLILILFFVASLFWKPVRRQICDWTYVCYYTCDEYTGEPIVITLNKTTTCEEIEFLRRERLARKVKSFFISPKPSQFSVEPDKKEKNNE